MSIDQKYADNLVVDKNQLTEEGGHQSSGFVVIIDQRRTVVVNSKFRGELNWNDDWIYICTSWCLLSVNHMKYKWCIPWTRGIEFLTLYFSLSSLCHCLCVYIVWDQCVRINRWFELLQNDVLSGFGNFYVLFAINDIVVIEKSALKLLHLSNK